VSEQLTQPLKWHGGKHYLAKHILPRMVEHVHYVEPFFGGGSVLLNKDPAGVSEVINDLNGELTNFWRVLQDEKSFAAFTKRMQVTPFSQNEWEAAAEPIGNEVERASRFFIRCRQSRAGKFDSFATLSRNRTRRGMNEQASAWLGAVDGLEAVSERMRRVVILNLNAVRVIRQQDGPNTLFYLDPPYLHETRVTTKDYEFEMSEEDHVQLLDTINQVQGKVLLSGYPNQLYDDALSHWDRWEIQIDNKASSAKNKPIKTEVLWANYTMPNEDEEAAN
jgi:DNA adenine methylase